MTDPRVERLAELVVDYSLELRKGQIVRVDGFDIAGGLALAVYRAALRAGAHPYTNVVPSGLLELLLEHGSSEQREFVSPVQWYEVGLLDALVTIWSEANTRSLSRVDPGRHAGYIAAHRQLSNRRWERIASGELRWCGTLFPTQAHAQDAEMSLSEYEDFVFSGGFEEAVFPPCFP